MITAQQIEVRVGARLLIDKVSLRVGPGDRIGLVGRNGAGKTTLTKILAGEALPAAGTVSRSSNVAYLPQDSRSGNLERTVQQRILSARRLDTIVDRLQLNQHQMGDPDRRTAKAAMERYARAEAELIAAGGYSAPAQAAQIAANLGLDAELLQRSLGALSGGQRRRVELARILFSEADILLLDEPTNHLDVDSLRWLRDFLRSYRGGLMVISHDVALLEGCVNKVFHLDAATSTLTTYNMGWQNYLTQRADDERRLRRQRVNAERKAASLIAQADKMRARANTAQAAKNMTRRAKSLLAEAGPTHSASHVARIDLPEPAHCGKTPLTAVQLAKAYGSTEVFMGVDLAIDRGSRVVILGLNGAGKTTLLRILAGLEPADLGEVRLGHGAQIGYYAQEHETLELSRSVLENFRTAAPNLADTQARNVLGAFLFSADDVYKPASVLSGGEKTRLALATLVVSSANVLLLDEPTNNLDPASRQEVLAAIERYTGAIVLVTHDPGAVAALKPDRVVILPEGVEDVWSPDYDELIELA